jgi:hypothetical protein
MPSVQVLRLSLPCLRIQANLGPGEYNIGVRDMVHELSTRLMAKNVLKHDLTVSQRYDFTSDVPGSPTNPGT